MMGLLLRVLLLATMPTVLLLATMPTLLLAATAMPAALASSSLVRRSCRSFVPFRRVRLDHRRAYMDSLN